MIRINLLGEKRDNSAIYMLQMLVFGGVLFLVLVACGVVQGAVSGNLEAKEQKKALLNAQVEKLRIKTAKVEELERKRKLLGEKLTTIATLKARKQGPVRVLDGLTASMPSRSWLKGVTQKSESLQFVGIALDNQTVSELMMNLRKSKFYKEVDLGITKQYMRDGVKLQEFTLAAKLGDPLMQRKLDEMKAPTEAVAKKGDKQAAADSEVQELARRDKAGSQAATKAE